MTAAKVLLTLLPAFCLALTACGGSDDAVDDDPGAPAPSVETLAFFEDLPDAGEVSVDDIGDLYFKLLIRTSTRIRAVRDKDDAQAARGIIAHARNQAATLKNRSEALPAAERAKLFQDSLAQILYARKQYDRAVDRIGPDDPAFLQDFSDYAGQPWPSLSR